MNQGPMLYYLPGEQVQSLTNERAAELLPRFGLSHCIGLEASCNQLHVAGPDGATGTVIQFSQPGSTEIARNLYKPMQQTWKNAGAFWLGWWNDATPGPASFRKGTKYNSKPVVLSDGNAWDFSTIYDLPKALGLNAEGALELAPLAKFDAVRAASDWIVDWYVTSENRPYSEILKHVCELLAVNYSISIAECLALAIFDTDNIIDAAKTGTGLDALEKKTASQNLDTSHGDAD